MAILARHPSHLLALAPRRRWTVRSRPVGRLASPPALSSRIERALAGLRRKGRRAVSIVDTGCGNGRLLLRSVARARALGFVAIDAAGFDPSAANVAAARAAALMARADPASGLQFAIRAPGAPLPVEDGDADIIIAAPADIGPDLLRIAGREGAIIRRS